MNDHTDDPPTIRRARRRVRWRRVSGAFLSFVGLFVAGAACWKVAILSDVLSSPFPVGAEYFGLPVPLVLAMSIGAQFCAGLWCAIGGLTMLLCRAAPFASEYGQWPVGSQFRKA